MHLRLMICATLALLGAACTTTTTTTVSNDGSSTITNERSSRKVTEADLRNRARARTDLAGGYYRNGQLAVALDEARRAVAIDPSYAEAYGLLGLIYMDMKEQRDAEESFQRALKLDAANSELNNNYGYFLCNTGRERESIAYFNQAIRDPLYRTPARANQNAGQCLMRIKDYAGCRALICAAHSSLTPAWRCRNSCWRNFISQPIRWRKPLFITTFWPSPLSRRRKVCGSGCAWRAPMPTCAPKLSLRTN